MKKHLEQGHLKWIRRIKSSPLNEIHEVADALGNAYILRVMEGTSQKIKMWQDLSQYHLPHLSKVMKVFHEDGKCYILEEKLSGTPLSQGDFNPRVRNHREVIYLGMGLAKDLSILFREEGILHLDIKPENLLINGHGNGKLIDFGAAVSAVDRTNLRTIPQMGTPRYMTPERYTDPNRIGPSADLYSLALTLKYAMVSWEITHFSLWQSLSHWSNPTWLEAVRVNDSNEWYALFIEALEEQLAT